MRVGVFFLGVTLVLAACTSKTDVDKLNFLTQGNTAYNNGDMPEAIRFYTEALQKDSAFADAWNNRGLAQMQMKLYDEAIYSFRQAVTAKPDYGEAMLNGSRANLAVRQYYAALDLVASLEKMWPDTSIVYFTRGLIYHEMGKNDEALDNFSEAGQRDSTNAEILINIANIYYDQKNYEQAIDKIKQSLVLDDRQAQAYNVLAMSYEAQNDLEAALSAINTAGSLDEKDAYIVNNKGYILYRMGNLADAEPYFLKSMQLDPYNPWVYRNLGLQRYAESKYSESVRMLEKAVAIDNSLDHIFIDLARACKANGQDEKACSYIKQAPESSEKNDLVAEICTNR